MGSVESETEGRFGRHWWSFIGPLRPSAGDTLEPGRALRQPPFFPACLFRVALRRQGGGGEEKYDGRTEGRDGHVTPTSLTVELAWELQLRQSAARRRESQMSSRLWLSAHGGGRGPLVDGRHGLPTSRFSVMVPQLAPVPPFPGDFLLKGQCGRCGRSHPALTPLPTGRLHAWELVNPYLCTELLFLVLLFFTDTQT